VRSRRKPSTNLANTVLELEQIRMFLLLPNVRTMIDQAGLADGLSMQDTDNIGKSHLVYSNDDYAEELYSPRMEKTLAEGEHRLLEEFYSRYESKKGGQIKVFTMHYKSRIKCLIPATFSTHFLGRYISCNNLWPSTSGKRGDPFVLIRKPQDRRCAS
jgi:hypothetical protein